MPAFNTMPFSGTETGLVHFGPFSPYVPFYPANALELGHIQSGTYIDEEYSLSSLMMSMVPASQTLFSDLSLGETFAEMPQAEKDRNLNNGPPLPSVQSNSPFCQVSPPTPSLRSSWKQPHNHWLSRMEMKQHHASGVSQRYQAFGSTQTQQQQPQRKLLGITTPKDIVFESNEPGQPDSFTLSFQKSKYMEMNQDRTADQRTPESIDEEFISGSRCLNLQMPHHSPTVMPPILQQHTPPDPTFLCASSVGSSELPLVSRVPKRLSKSSANGVMSLPQRRHRRSTHRVATQNNTNRIGASRQETNGFCNSQATLYSCHKVNPRTGELCRITFSRPYDLTRHEDSIHNNKKRPQCNLCIEENTFSRADALKRHYRVCHPDVELAIKHQRRDS